MSSRRGRAGKHIGKRFLKRKKKRNIRKYGWPRKYV